MTTAPKFVPDNNTPAAAPPEVPQWSEPMRYDVPQSNGCAGCPRLFVGTKWVGEICGAVYLGHNSVKYAERIVALWNDDIARHAPQPEAQPATETADEREANLSTEQVEQMLAESWKIIKNAEGNALPALPATGAASGVERFIVNNNSVRYACTKLAAVGDKVKVIGSNPPLHMNVEEISPTGGLYIKSLTGTACMLLNSSQVEFVPEIPPAGEAAVWPRYFRLCEDGNWRWVQYKPDLPLLYKKFDGSMTNADVNIEELMNRNDAIETDAHGNALQKHDASVPTREWISKMADGEEKCASVSARSPDAFEKQEASGVERWQIYRCNTPTFVVTASDHDRVVAEKDATIAELRAEVKQLEGDYDSQLDDWRKERTRAEAAEAEVARLTKERDEAKETVGIVLSSMRWTGDGYEWTGGQYDYRMTPADALAATQGMLHQLRSAKKELTAQLAAANERVREAYAILCQLENVYRRQSTESVGSFGVSQEVHSLLKRAMDTLNGKEKQ